MATPVWFDAAHYKAEKLAQLTATDSNGAWTASKLDTVMGTAGYAGNDGWFKHFTEYGADEHCSPNATFNAAEYLTAKLAQLEASDKVWVGKTLNDVQAAFKAAGLGEWEHYHLYGMAEGLNPSNAFDEIAYLDAKLAQLVATDAAKWTGKTNADVRAALQAADLSALEHYMLYGKAEGIEAIAVPAEEQVTVPADFFIFGGKGGMPSAGFDLTRGSDNLTGTAGNDSFFAADADGFQTLNATDTLNGGAGEDTLFIGNGGGAINFGAASIKGIETVVAAGVNGALDVSANADVKNVTVSLGGSVNAKLAQNVAFENVANNGAEVTFADATGKEDAVTVKLANNGDMNALEVGKIEKLTLDVTGKNVSIDANKETAIEFAASGLQELIVTGEGSLKLKDATGANVGTGGSIKVLDFSANKGGVEFAYNATNLNTKNVTVKGGIGDDAVTIAAGTASMAGTLLDVDMGAGNDTFEVRTGVKKDSVVKGGDGTDTLIINGVSTVNDAFAAHFSDFEAVMLKGVATYESTAFGKAITSVTVLGDDATTTIVKDLGFVAVSDGASSTVAGLTVNVTGTADVTFDNLQEGKDAGAGISVGLYNGTAVKLNIHSEGYTSSANSLNIASGSATGLTKISINGDQDFTLTSNEQAAGSLEKIDASGLSGDLTLELSARTETIEIIGGSGENTITAGTAVNDSINLKASVGQQDSIKFFGAALATGTDTISYFETGDGGDLITLNDGDPNNATVVLHNAGSLGANLKSAANLDAATTVNEIGISIKDAATSTTKLATYLSTNIPTQAAIGDKAILVVYSDTDAYMYHFTATAADKTVVPNALKLLGVFEDVAVGSFDAGNFVW